MRALLGIPAVYSAFAGFVIGNGRFDQTYLGRHVRAKSGDHVLDIGCGPGAMLDHLPPGLIYTGFDLSPSYIESAQRNYSDRGTFILTGVDEKWIGAFPGQDLILATGVLHHLPDDLADLLIRIAWSNLKPGGRFVASDGCLTNDQPWLNRWMVRQDRGEYIREAPRYVELARAHFRQVDQFVYHNLLRIPYSHAMMECRREEA